MNLGKNILLHSTILILIAFSIIFGSILITTNLPLANNTSTTIQPLASTNPAAPELMSDDAWQMDTFSTGLDYYYYSYTMSASSYNLFWIKSNSTGDDSNLYLYADSSYSSLLTSSIRSDEFDWIVLRTVSSGTAYLRVNAYDASGTGVNYLEAETAPTGNFGTSYYVCQGGVPEYEIGDINQYYLTANSSYKAYLFVDTGTDIDLYCYFLGSGGVGDHDDYIFSNISSSPGVDEQIDIIPSVSGWYAFVTIKKSGTSIGSLNVYITNDKGSLADDASEYDTYPDQGVRYQYDTYTMDIYDYHLIWTYFQTSANDADLYLYSNSVYTNLVGTSDRGTQLEWLVYNPTINQTMYPVFHTKGGENSAYIEAESAYDITLGNGHSEYLSSEDYCSLVEVSLTSWVEYTVKLTVPDTCDFDLYVFRVDSGTCTEEDSHNSTAAVLGQDEFITFRPTQNDRYAILATRTSGNGTSIIEIDATDKGDLFDGVPELDSFDVEDMTYHYTSYFMTYDQYNIIWLYYQTELNDMDLQLYSDANYSTLVGNSSRGSQVEWLIYKPIASQPMYPAAFNNLGTNTAYIEAESANTITLESSDTQTLNISNSAHILQVSLTSGNSYTVSLSVPDTGDFDLYVLRFTDGTCTEIESWSSKNSTFGADEVITFIPSATALYALLAIRVNGTGASTISIIENSNIPGFEIVPIFIGIICAIYISIIFIRKKFKTNFKIY